METAQLSGRELEKEVAERVMGQVACDKWQHINFGSGGGPAMINEGCDHDGQCFPAETGPSHYSESIEAAMQVVEHFQKRGYMVSVNASSEGGWWCCTYPPDGPFIESPHEATAALAICRAALAAIKGS